MFKVLKFSTNKRKGKEFFKVLNYRTSDVINIQVEDDKGNMTNAIGLNYKDVPALMSRLEKLYNQKCIDNGESPKVTF